MRCRVVCRLRWRVVLFFLGVFFYGIGDIARGLVNRIGIFRRLRVGVVVEVGGVAIWCLLLFFILVFDASRGGICFYFVWCGFRLLSCLVEWRVGGPCGVVLGWLCVFWFV